MSGESPAIEAARERLARLGRDIQSRDGGRSIEELKQKANEGAHEGLAVLREIFEAFLGTNRGPGTQEIEGTWKGQTLGR
jgi:hypothetical protein